MTRTFVKVARESEIAEGEARDYSIEGTGILLCRVDGKIYAIEDICTHDDGPLGLGELDGCEIECPRHGARFDVRTGEVRRMPAIAPIASFPVRIEEGDVLVELEVDEPR